MNLIRPIVDAAQAADTYTVADIGAALDDLAIGPASTVMMHSALVRLGRLHAVAVRDYPAAVTAAIRDHLGPAGTLVVPAANWDYGAARATFDIARSPVSKPLGVIPAYVNGLAERRRSGNPIFAVAAVGPRAEAICGGNTAHAFGPNSAWQRMAGGGTDMLCFGTDFEFLTFVRYIETHAGVPYLYNKYFDVPLTDDGAPRDWPVIAPLRYHHLPIRYALDRFEARCRAAGVLRENKLGAGRVIAITMADCLAVGLEALAGDIHYFLAAPPDYVADALPRT